MTPARRQERGESRQGRVKALPLRGDRPYTGDVARAGSSRGIEVPLVGWALAGFGPIVVAAALVPLREELVSTNLALILVVVVALSAIAGGRGPGLLAAVIAAMSYDFFLTKPYLHLRIDNADDLETALILLVIGLVVGQIVVVARRRRIAAALGSDEIQRLHRVAEQAAAGAPIDDIVLAVNAELTGLLHLRDCSYEAQPSPSAELPRIERDGRISGVHFRRFAGEEFALPIDGVELLVLGRGKEFGRFVLLPDPERGASLEQRVVAVALSDLLGAALAAGSAPLATAEA